MMTDKQKQWIDRASYQEMLSLWRHAPIGEPMFQDETGAYFSLVMRRKRKAIGAHEAAIPTDSPVPCTCNAACGRKKVTTPGRGCTCCCGEMEADAPQEIVEHRQREESE